MILRTPLLICGNISIIMRRKWRGMTVPRTIKLQEHIKADHTEAIKQSCNGEKQVKMQQTNSVIKKNT